MSSCSIDLPKNDVVESIDYERFFVLNLSYGDLRGPATLSFGRADNQFFNAVPLSADPEDWAAFRARTTYLRMSNLRSPNDLLNEAAISPRDDIFPGMAAGAAGAAGAAALPAQPAAPTRSTKPAARAPLCSPT